MGKTLTITSGITGDPNVRIASGNATNDLHFYPETEDQALGDITAPYYASNNNDKCELRFGGTTTGNTVGSIGYLNTDPETGLSRNCHYGYMYKVGTSTWTINGDVNQGKVDIQQGTLIINGTFTSLYQGLYAIPSGAKLGGNLAYYQADARFGHFKVNSGGIVAPGNPDVDGGVGTISLEWAENRNDTAYAYFYDGAIYEWQVGGNDANRPTIITRLATTFRILHICRSSQKPLHP